MSDSIRSIKRARNIKGKRVLVRIDCNVPLEKKKVLNDSRLHASIPTIEYLLSKEARVILVGHLGRPEGKKKASLSLAPVSARLGKLMGKKIMQLPDVKGKKVEAAIGRMKSGSAVMLENIRFSKHEEGNTGDLGQYLSKLADIFVFDGFSVAHRADASIVGIAPYLPSYAGLQLEKELAGLEKIMKKTARPAVLVLGGAKSETKIPVVKHFINRADHILLGGALFNTYLSSLGYAIGDSLVDPGVVQEANKFIRNKKVIRPRDIIVGKKDGSSYRHVRITKQEKRLCRKGEAILDIGPETIGEFALHIKEAKTIVWNGAMGYFEQAPYDTGTRAIARLIAAQSKGKAYGVVGGGETVQIIEEMGLAGYIDLVSTGGGAMLELLSGKTLPGIDALLK